MLVHGILEITLAKAFAFEIAIGAGYRVAAIKLDVARGPRISQAQFTPLLNYCPNSIWVNATQPSSLFWRNLHIHLLFLGSTQPINPKKVDKEAYKL